MGGHVFLSYGRDAKGSSYVAHLADFLIGQGLKVWYDRRLASGDQWADAIRHHVESCSSFVVIMTPHADESEWVKLEITYAEEAGKPIMPVLLDGRHFPQLSSIQYEDVRGHRYLPSARFIGKLYFHADAFAGSANRTEPVSLFIGGLPFGASARTLSDFLWQWVEPHSAGIILDTATGRSKGFGFAQVRNPEDAMLACREGSAMSLDGRLITINVQKSIAKGPPHGWAPTQYARVESAANDGLSVSPALNGVQRDMLHTLNAVALDSTSWMPCIFQLYGTRRADSGPARLQIEELVRLLAKNPLLLDDLDPRLFEHLVAALLTGSGYREVRLAIPGIANSGTILATKRSGLSDSLYVVRCKYLPSSHLVAESDVSVAHGLVNDLSATSGVIVTTAEFSGSAGRLIERHRHRIRGIGGSDLRNWPRSVRGV